MNFRAPLRRLEVLMKALTDLGHSVEARKANEAEIVRIFDDATGKLIWECPTVRAFGFDGTGEQYDSALASVAAFHK